MKRSIAFVCALVASSFTFAGTTAAGLSKGSDQLNALSSTWKAQSGKHPQTKNDITIVYGGDDVSRPSFNLHSITA